MLSKTIAMSMWNINGLRAMLKKGNLLQYLTTNELDIICLNEIRIDQEKFKHECKMQDDKKYHFKASPKDSNLSKVFKEIEIIGANQPEVINYIDSRDDKTQVEFIK